MEVFIRGVPPREAERSLNDFFDGVLSRLRMEDWMVQKLPRTSFAKLIFLRSEDGERFLSLHGQTKNIYGRNVLLPTATSLIFKGQSLFCTRSREMNIFALRSLEMDRKSRAKESKNLAKVDTEDLQILSCFSISCGIWDYTQSGVVFRPFFTLQAPATIKFKTKAIFVETNASQRLEIISQTVESIIWESSMTNSIFLTMREAPRISVRPEDMGAALLEDFDTLFNSIFANNYDTPSRNRASGLNQNHEELAGSCFVYQLILSEGVGFNEPTRGLSLTRGLPSIVRRHIMINQTSVSYAAHLRTLLQHLSPNSTSLPFDVRFQLQKLAQNGYLPPSKVIDLIPEVQKLCARSGSRVCVNAIRRLFYCIPYAGPDTEAKHFHLHHLTALLGKTESELKSGGLYSDEVKSSDQVAIIHKVMVTPCGIYLYGPDRECNNRVLRKYAAHHDFFLRVQFCDEDGLPVRYNSEMSNKSIFERFKSILNKGFAIAGRHFSFLGFSHSSLRSQSCWFMAPFSYNRSLIYYNDIIKDLGNFSGIRIPAKCAARIGQAFSDTRDAITLDPGIVKNDNELLDVERNERLFSDGVGTSSQEALEYIWSKLPRGRIKPTVLQIRFQGAKGVIALDSRLSGKSIFIRPSMIKFRGSTSNDVEICTAAYKTNKLYLNEQLIKILEDMGVSLHFFLDVQAKEIERLRSTTTSTEEASDSLESQSIGEEVHLSRFMKKLPNLQLSFQDDNFFTDVVETAVLIQLRKLKYKARIPVRDGFTLLGIMDETGILEEGEIFCIIDEEGRGRVITGKAGQRVIITRSPALHPGDVQLATATTVPEDSPLMQLRNCICFSQKGSRDLPSMLSGGDLDGDTFHIIFDPNAQARKTFPPADYIKQTPRELPRPVKRQDMADFFVEFMETDQLGRICNVHKILADQSPDGVNDARCIKLAEMASTAVDFSKTGIPVDMSEMPRHSRFRPHFMAPGPHIEIERDKPISFDEDKSSTPNTGDNEDGSTGYRYYPSDKILGKLFDAVDEREIFHRMQKNSSEHALHRDDREWDRNWSMLRAIWEHIQDRYRSFNWESHLDRARSIRDEKVFPYENSLLNIMFEYGPRPHLLLSEIEVFIGDILGKTGALTTRQRELCLSMKERFAEVLSSTIEWMRVEEYDLEEEESKANQAAPEHALEVGLACLWVALNEKPKIWESGKNRTSRLRSFGYVAAAVCLTEAENISGR